MLKKISYLSVLVFAILLTSILSAEQGFAEMGGQVFYRYGIANLKDDRGGEVFTDTLNYLKEGSNNGTRGWNVSAGLDLPLLKDIGPGTLLGEIMVDYASFSKKKVTQATSTLLQLDGTTVVHSTNEVAVSELAVVVAPKYRIDLYDGKLRPWIIPAGLVFLVNSPPSNDTTYLDIGYQFGAGIEYRILEPLSIGLDYRYTIASGEPNMKATYSTIALYMGINF
ncbi:MAG: outer membrane beta-barrel protein [Deltaproteobacteria bacterium]|nr:outer membrane beta-barrel protein [Deltaproteobacteria bacterium]